MIITRPTIENGNIGGVKRNFKSDKAEVAKKSNTCQNASKIINASVISKAPFLGLILE